MRSIKTKIIGLVLFCIILSSVAIGGASIINSKRVVTSDSTQIMNLLCENRADKINALFSRIEQSVETLNIYIIKRLDVTQLKTNPDYVKNYSEALLDVAMNAADNTEGAMTVYVRFNPEFTNPKSGFFCGKNSLDGDIHILDPTDLSAYTPEESEYVGWFYEPRKNNRGTWMAPYLNRNIDVEIISYVIPLVIDGEFVGVVGMDIDFSIVRDIVDNTRIYNTGYAFLTNKRAEIMHHKDLERYTDLLTFNNEEFGHVAQMLTEFETNTEKLILYNYLGSPKKAAYRSLNNGMRLVLTAPTAEIDYQENQLFRQILTVSAIVILVVTLFAFVFAKRMVKPLLELTEAAKRVAQGDLEVEVIHRSRDEVGTLVDSFRQTVAHLKQYISYIKEQAYIDTLTGMRNKTAYMAMLLQKEQEISEKTAKFGVIVFDVNGLKNVNDSYGHDFGDILIISASKIIKKVFCRGPVYRIGGDEFVTILENWDYEQCQELMDMFQEEMALFNENSPLSETMVSIACGVAMYSPEADQSFNDVFKKADSAMYFDKAKTKSGQTVS